MRSIKLIITLSFVFLISLCLLGITLMYLELVELSEVNDISQERDELVIVSNTLASLYKAEGVGSIFISDPTPSLKLEYDSLMDQVYFHIDSLKKLSQDEIQQVHLDTVTFLLDKKRENIYKISQLLDSINQQVVIPISRTSILSKKDIADLDKILQNTTQKQEDTTIIELGKKNFFQRVKDVFQPGKDSSIVISSNMMTKDIDSISVPVLKDTLVEYVHDIVLDYNRRNSVFMRQLVYRQNMMHVMNEELTIQINKILMDVEHREYEMSLQILQKKEDVLNRSSKIAYLISMIALGFTLISLIIIYRILANNQRYRKEIENAKKYAENLLAARERLILTITHNIKAPISSIIGYMELLYKSKLPEREKYYVKNMQNSAEHVLQLVKDLLDYHALESDKQEINIMPFSPYMLFRDIFNSFIPEADRNDIRMEFCCDIDIETAYESDPYRLRQIVNNLFSNALKFTPPGGHIVFSSTLIPRSGIFDLVISLKDSGCGIKEEEQTIIFEEFRRLNSGKEVEGSGLGLPITQKQVRLLKGNIVLKSMVGKGSEFIITVPMNKSGKNPDPVGQEEIKKLLNVDTNKKILFIDDDIVQLNLLSELLKNEGFTPVICNDSTDALNLIQNTSFDLIFTDIQMPDMNGFELVDRIRMANIRGSKTIPVIALSASSAISQQKYIEAGFSDFLSKPISVSQLLEKVSFYLEGEEIQSFTENESSGFNSLIQFASDDKEASREIINSFIDENHKNLLNLKTALNNDDWDNVKKISHKMLPLMRMISEVEIVNILCSFEAGSRDKEVGHKLVVRIGALLTKASYFCSKL